MRVTAESQLQQSLLNIQANYARVTKLQEQISSGVRLQLASDGPADMVQVLQNNAQNSRLDADLNVIQNSTTKLQSSVDALTQAQNILTSVKNLALQANDASHSPAADATLASQVDASINQLLQLANQQLPDGSYLFGGTASTKPPFVVSSTNGSGQADRIVYRGSQQDSEAVVGSSLNVTTLISGSDVFQSRSRGTTTYGGTTGAAAGTGTDSATGVGTLLVQHTLTTFAGASGVSAGTSSATGDTVIGPAGANSLVINDTSGTGASGSVALNGGPPVTFTSGDTNLKVTGPNGEIVYLNTTAISPGFSGNVALTATGTLSVDGGNTSTPIDFSNNQVVVDGASNAVTNVDSSNIRRAGADRISYVGTSDVFQTLIALRDTLRNTQGLTASERSAALNQQLADIDRASTAVANVMGTQSVQAQSLLALKDQVSQMQLNLQKATDGLQSTDTTTAIVDLQRQMNLYQASLQLAAQLNSLTLVNFLN